MTQIKIMSDRQQAQLYFGLVRDYSKYTAFQNPPMTMRQIYDALYYGVYHSVNSPDSGLYHLHPSEKLKAFTILNAFFSSTWQYRDQDHSSPIMLYSYTRAPDLQSFPEQHLLVIQNQRYCCHDDLMFKLWIWSSLAQSRRPLYPAGARGRSETRHGHPTQKKSKSGESIALLVLVVLAAFTLALSFIALYCLLSESVHNIERMIFSEGCLQAILSFFSMAAAGTASALLASAYAVEPLTSLAFAAGLSSPVGVVLFGIISLAILGATVGCFITDQVQKYVIKASNPDALDPADPHRYELTASEARALLQKGYDPIKVKCAMLALRAIIGDKPVPSLLGSPWFSRSKEVQSALDQIRNLRCGKGLPIVKVGDLHFDCRQDLHIVEDRLDLESQYPPAYSETHEIQRARITPKFGFAESSKKTECAPFIDSVQAFT